MGMITTAFEILVCACLFVALFIVIWFGIECVKAFINGTSENDDNDKSK